MLLALSISRTEAYLNLSFLHLSSIPNVVYTLYSLIAIYLFTVSIMIAFYIESQQNTFSIFINAIPNIIMEINIDNSFH